MKQLVSLVRETYKHWNSCNASRMGAAVAYYAVFSIGPLLILLISIAGIVFTKTEALSSIIYHLNHAVGKASAQYLLSIVQAINIDNLSVAGAIIGAVILLYAALSAISELDRNLEELWQLPKRIKNTKGFWAGVKRFIKAKISAVGVILLSAAVIIISIAFTIVFKKMPGYGLLQNLLTFVLGIVFFMILYRILPVTKLPWKELLRGAVFTSVLFLIGKLIIGSYLSYENTSAGFGPAGSLVAILAWIYYSAQVFFFSASFTFVYSKKYGYLSKKD